MSYCHRLLHTDILPQKLSRRSAAVILSASSGVAWTSTGTSSPDNRIAFATPRSSPKLGRVTSTPSISSRCCSNRAAHFLASSSVSTEPNLVSSGPRITAAMPSSSSTRRTSARPLSQRWSGKNPRLPTMTPNVGFCIRTWSPFNASWSAALCPTWASCRRREGVEYTTIVAKSPPSVTGGAPRGEATGRTTPPQCAAGALIPLAERLP